MSLSVVLGKIPMTPEGGIPPQECLQWILLLGFQVELSMAPEQALLVGMLSWPGRRQMGVNPREEPSFECAVHAAGRAQELTGDCPQRNFAEAQEH